MECPSIALGLSILLLIIVIAVCWCWRGNEQFSQDFKISGVFDDGDVDLKIKSHASNTTYPFIGKLLGRNNKKKIEFKIHKKEGSYNVTIPPFSDYSFEGKGLVIAANGLKYRYITGLYMNVYVIRKLFNSNIPIEIMYVGREEDFPREIRKKLMDLQNIKLIDITQRFNTNVKNKRLKGYRTKPLAVLCSSFKEIILMDADSLSFIDPYNLFDLEGYKNKGMVLFKDYVPCLKYISSSFMNRIGIGSHNYCKLTGNFEIDSSCVVLNKELAWEALFSICTINVESDTYYSKEKNVLGDKDTWLIGSLFVGFSPHVSEIDPGVMLLDQDGTNIVIPGHLQLQKGDNFDEQSGSNLVPLYYNNQAVNLINYNTTYKWNWTNKIINPRMGAQWNNNSHPITRNMEKTFEVASGCLDNIFPYIKNSMKSKISNSIVGPGFINY